jgi:hypothetical protein
VAQIPRPLAVQIPQLPVAQSLRVVEKLRVVVLKVPQVEIPQMEPLKALV